MSLYVTPRLQGVFNRAKGERLAHHADFITPRDLLLAIVVEPNDPAALLLKRFGLDYERLVNVRPDNLEKFKAANVVTVVAPSEPEEPRRRCR